MSYDYDKDFEERGIVLWNKKKDRPATVKEVGDWVASRPKKPIDWGEAFLAVVLPGIPFLILAIVAYSSGAYRPLYGW